MKTPPLQMNQLRQELKFEILVPLVSGQVIKFQRESGKLTKQSSHVEYNKAVDAILSAIEAALPEPQTFYSEEYGEPVPYELYLVSDIKAILTNDKGESLDATDK